MAWRRPPPELVERFERVFPDDARAERRPMFGCSAGFVHGNMFCAVWQEYIVLRLADAARHEMLKLPGVKVFEPNEGRPLREYVRVTPGIFEDDATLAKWMKRAFDYASALPAKQKKPRAKPAPRRPPRRGTPS